MPRMTYDERADRFDADLAAAVAAHDSDHALLALLSRPRLDVPGRSRRSAAHHRGHGRPPARHRGRYRTAGHRGPARRPRVVRPDRHRVGWPAAGQDQDTQVVGVHLPGLQHVQAGVTFPGQRPEDLLTLEVGVAGGPPVPRPPSAVGAPGRHRTPGPRPAARPATTACSSLFTPVQRYPDHGPRGHRGGHDVERLRRGTKCGPNSICPPERSSLNCHSPWAPR